MRYTLLSLVAPVVVAQYDPGVALNFALLAGTAYCDGGAISTWTCAPCGNFSSSVNGATFLSDSNLDVYGYVAGMNDGSIVVSFRGTNPSDIENWIVDLNTSQTELYPGCSGCAVHSGFYGGFLALSSQMMAAVDAYGGANAAYIITTGHSLGAAMSTLASYELAAAGYPLTQAINFGDPRVGNPAFAASYASLVINGNPTPLSAEHMVKPMRWSDSMKASVARALPQNDSVKFDVGIFQGAGSIRVTHWRDPVPHLPPELLGFAHEPQEVWYTEDQSSYTVCDATNGEDPNCADSLFWTLSVDDHLSYLGIPISDLC